VQSNAIGKFPEIRQYSLYQRFDISDSSSIALVPWHELFTDTCLQVMIEKALVIILTCWLPLQSKKAEAALRQKPGRYFHLSMQVLMQHFKAKPEGLEYLNIISFWKHKLGS
jgi:hypothetical protein